ncbi:ABC transporter substrate-binding protein [Paenibacillus sp. 2TAB19]|uniref:ABC transporter substrate-binding protein n=1 Tax=Paenibacillus sp. 2TAB19 TaxID=3233003 RepID=UPI003F958F90
MKKRNMPLLTACIILLVALVVGACSNNAGNTGNKGGNATNAPSEATNSPSNEGTGTTEQASYPREVDSAGGEKVTIEAQPKIVALVHWGLTQELMNFDLDSIAITLSFTEKQSFLGTEVYKPYVAQYDDVSVVGENTQVNLEALLQYAPDVILAGSATNKDIADQLKQIAPTVFIDEEQTNVWTDWQGVMTQLGAVLGLEDNAKAKIDEASAQVEQAKQQLDGVEGTVAYLQVRDKNIWLQGTAYAGDYYAPLGLTPPKEAEGDGVELTLEGLAAINPDHIFLGYFNYNDKSMAALSDEWEQSEVWKKLKAVQSNQVYAIDGELAFGYGPISRTNGTAAIAEALKK